MLWQAASPQGAHIMCAGLFGDLKHVRARLQAAYIGGLCIASAAIAIVHMGLVLV